MADLSVSPAGMRLIKLLVGNPPTTIAKLIEASGVTRTAVTEQLAELMAGGFVERQMERSRGRGRPHYLYAAKPAALLLLFADAQRWFVPAMWKAIEESGGKALTQRVVTSVACQVAERYKNRLPQSDPRARLEQLGKLLRKEGALVEVVEEDGALVLRKRSCPFASMLDDDRSVCCVDEEMMSIAVGHPVRRVAYRHEGDPCCSFNLRNGR